MPTIAFLLARLSEPSSYAGLGAVLALVGLHFSDALLGQAAQALAAVCGLLALVLRERGLIQVIALAVLAATGLSACAGGVPSPASIAAPAQSACTVVSWGVPIVRAMSAKLNPNDQAILAQAEEAVSACAAGNASAAAADIAAALTAIIYPPAS